MTPEAVIEQAREVLGSAYAQGAVSFGSATIDVDPGAWRAAAEALSADPTLDLRMFDFLTAVDEAADGFSVVCRLVSPGTGGAVLLRTRVPRHEPDVASLTPLFAGAAWAERETSEMFGITFHGHPDPRPLLLPDTFDGHPLRKDFPLAARAVQPWPGAHDPKATGSTVAAAGGTARHRTHRPPGGVEGADWLSEDRHV